MMKNCDQPVQRNHNPNWPYIISLIIHKNLMIFMKIWKTIIQQRKGEY